MKLHLSNTKQEVAEEFSQFLIAYASGKEKVTVALSGGSTPKIVFDYLSQNEESTDWTRFHFFWGDERCVPPTDNDSNYKMTVEHLLSKIDIPEENIHRIKGENDPTYEAERYGRALKKKLDSNNDIPQFDLVILGMGDDGHTASIFPYEISLWNDEKFIVVATHPDSGQKRISITGQVINNAKTVTFLVTGESKAEKVKAIFNKEEDYLQYPAALVAPTSGELHWFIDAGAHSGIELE